jgi:hypothetical protein
MRTRRLAAALAGLLVLAGCSGTKSVAFYKAHPGWRARVADKCVAQGSRSQDCRNAVQASFEELHIPAHDGVADVSAPATPRTPAAPTPP